MAPRGVQPPRSTGVESAGESITFGDPEVAELLQQALAAAGDVDRFTHGFHTYPAGLHPDAARALVRGFPARALLDPFVGGGTVLVEGRAAGLRTHGRDVSPVAVLVASARTSSAPEALLTRVRSTARKATEAARKATAPPPPRILAAAEQWYAPYVLCELEALRQAIAAAEADVQPLLRAALSSLLVKVSWRRSDTSPQRVKHRRPPGSAAILFHKKVRELGRRVAALREAVPEGTPPAELALQDARTLALPSGPVDLVVTSPPYPSTYDYLAMQHLRRVWLDLSAPPAAEIGARKAWREGERAARRQWRSDTAAWTARAAAALAPGGHLVVVIGDGLTPAGTVDTSEATEAAAREAGLVPVARASTERVDHARGETRWEHAFAFAKPSAATMGAEGVDAE